MGHVECIFERHEERVQDKFRDLKEPFVDACDMEQVTARQSAQTDVTFSEHQVSSKSASDATTSRCCVP
eukprot:768462-Hanusia_phi.AAC.4